MSEVIPFPKKDGNGAREALEKILDEITDKFDSHYLDKLLTVDHILLKLAAAGYVIKPLDDQ